MKNKLKIKITFILIVITSILLIVILKHDKKNFIEKDTGYDVAIYVNGTKASSSTDLSSKKYRVSASCKNADASWDYANWKLKVSNVIGDVSCSVSFISSSTNFSNYLISKVSSTTSGTESRLENINGYRYRGVDPDNYVMFNNELWRIIGVFGSSDHGITDTNLVKIIRNDSIGDFWWDMSSNSFVDILNNYYYTSTDGSGNDDCKIYMTTTTSSDCKKYKTDLLSDKCDFTDSGLNSSTMIANVYWNLPENTYGATKSSIYSSYIYDGTINNFQSYVGLMNAADFMYASTTDTCTDSSNVGAYDCFTNNWLNKYHYEYLLRQSYNVLNSGQLTSSSCYYAYLSVAVRPAVYLSSDVVVIAGDGSMENPYIITK